MQSSVIFSRRSLRLLLCGKQGSYMTDDVRVLAYHLWPCSFWAHCLTNWQASWSSCRSARCSHALMQTLLAMMHRGIAPCVPRQLKSTPSGCTFIEGCVHILGISQSCFRKLIFCMHICEKVPQPLVVVACLPQMSTTCCHLSTLHALPTGPAGFAP